MSDSLGGEEAGPDAAEPEVSIPRAVTTSAGTVSYARPSSPLDGSGTGNGIGNGDASTNGGAATRPMTPAERRRAKRLAYWNRPKPPKDWRYWVGGTGRVLITLGLLMFAFVAYQLWGTGIEQARAQHKLDNELEERRAALGTVPVLIPASTVTTVPPATVPGDPSPPATEAPTTAPPVLSLPPIAEGDVIGELRIPRIDLDQKVVAGVSVPDLKKGPGHFPETPLPGELGNAAIAGHRTTYGGPFLHLDEPEPGDEIVWVDLFGQEFVYRVTGSEIVKPSQGEVINTADPTKATLVLITCDPVRTSKNRLVIHAELVEERSPAPTAGQEYYGQDVGSSISELPGGDLPPEETATATSAVDETTPATTAGTTAAPAGATADDADRPAGFSDTDPFAQGWFSDSAAWPQIIAWGFGLLVVVLGCYALARALKRRWVGWVVAVAPFTFLLYFFFQNVNRLLPPGL